MPLPEQLPSPRPKAPEVAKSAPRSTETLTTGREIIGRMVDMIGEAKHSIDLQFYSFEADSTGRRVLDALADAKKRNPNIKIRLLVDNTTRMRHDRSFVGNNESAKKKRDETFKVLDTLREEGILDDVRVTNWLPQNPLINAFHLYSKTFFRDHKKLALVDARDLQENPDAVPQGLITSANIAAYHENNLKELGRLYHGAGGPVPYLAQDFDYTFEHAQEWQNAYPLRTTRFIGKDLLKSLFNPLKPGERMTFRDGPKGHDSAVLTDSLLGKMPVVEKLLGRKLGGQEATDELFSMLDLARPGDSITAFTPFPGLILLAKHLREAAKRGVVVNLVMSKNYNNELVVPKNASILAKTMQAFYFGWFGRLAKSGVTVYAYKGEKEDNNGELHAKGAVLVRSDNTVRTLIGSTNFSKGPVAGRNREIAVVEESDISDPLIAYARDLMHDSEIIGKHF